MRESEDVLLGELEALYAESDALFAGATCERSSECCRFGITGREPQVTGLEMALVKRALRARGGPLSPKRRALPLASFSGPGSRAPKDERTCPMLDASQGCSIYASRPLGCRTFFCQRAELPSPPARKQLKQLVRRLEELAARHRPQGDKPQAFTRALSALK